MLFKKLPYLLMVLAIVLSCSDSETVKDENSERAKELQLVSPEEISINDLIDEASRLQLDIGKGLLLRSNNERDKTTFKDALYNTKVALMMLRQNNQDINALESLRTAMNYVDGFALLNNDASRIRSFFGRVGNLLYLISDRMELSVGDLSWPLFRYTFYDGIKPFVSVSNDTEWESDYALDKTFAKVRGSGLRSWLISPEFDFRNVKNPALRLRHLTIVDKNNREDKVPFKRAEISNEAFTAYVLKNFRTGSPEDAIAVKLDLGALPSGSDFHTVNTPDIDLSEFAGSESISIGLLFNTESDKVGSHYLTWQIEDFQIRGATDGLKYRIAPAGNVLFQHKFDKEDPAPFLQVDVEDAGAKWEPFGFDNGIQFQKVYSDRQKSDTWLLSPRLDMRGVSDTSMKVTFVGHNPNSANMKMLVSENYDGEDPLQAEWLEINHLPADKEFRENKWDNYGLVYSDLDKFLGKQITIAFRLIAESTDAKLGWEVGELTITGLGDPIQSKSFNLSGGGGATVVNNPNDVSLEFVACNSPVSAGNAFYSHDFNLGFGEFRQQTLEGEGAAFNIVDFQGSKKVEISGFKPKRIGKQLLYSCIIDGSGKDDIKIRVNQSLNFYDSLASEPFEERKVRILVAEVSPGTVKANAVKWQAIDFKKFPEGNNWDAVQTEDFLLPANLQGKSLVIAFEYTSDDFTAPNWQLFKTELVSGEFKMPTISDCEQKPRDGVGDKVIVFKHNFDAGQGEFNQMTLAGDGAQFSISDFQGVSRLKISGHKPLKLGTQLMYSCAIDAAALKNVQVSVNQAINFYTGFTDETVETRRTKISVAEVVEGKPISELKWIPFDFKSLPFGDSYDQVTTEFLPLPDSLLGKKVAVGFIYTSDDDVRANWEIFELNILSEK